MCIPLLFLVLWRNEIVESEDKREDKDVGGVLTDVACEYEYEDVDGDVFCNIFVILDDDDDGSSETDDDGSSETDDGSSETDEVGDDDDSFEIDDSDDSSKIDEIDDDSFEGWLGAEGWS